MIGTGVLCKGDTDCKSGETCQMNQEDFNDNGIGDVCECYADYNNDHKVTGADKALATIEYGKCCSEANPCQADGNQDGKVTGADKLLLTIEYGRYDCPISPAML